MAPKKAPAADKNKDAKGKSDDAKPADDKGEKKTLFQKIKDFWASPMGIYVAIVFTIILVVMAIGSALVCLNEASRTADLRYAMELVKKFMMTKDPSYETRDDIETIFDADQIAGELAALALLLNDLENEIAGIRYRLNHDWMANKDAIYLFVSGANTWHNAVKVCEKEKAKLVHIESEHEEILG
ncbi:uncharacterized protein LOC110071156 isoform X2 [Pogona vitticeps]|uniref:Uncharacterized protein n=1 Tax=Pogona vitticeps TaxID=103695 RepID=A0ABM5GKS9_9SAUR